MPTMSTYDDKALLLPIASGDEEAFAALYHQYQDMVKRFVLKFVKSQELSDDIVQEVFIKIWENRNQLLKVNCFKAYILIVVRNHTLNFLKQVAQNAAVTMEVIKHYQEFRSDTEEKLLSKEYLQCLQNIVQTLPDQTRRVLNLCREQDKSYDEAAQILGISRHAVKKHMVRANKVFKSSFKNLLDIPFNLLVALLFFFK